MAEQNRPAPQILDDLKVIDLSSMIAGRPAGGCSPSLAPT